MDGTYSEDERVGGLCNKHRLDKLERAHTLIAKFRADTRETLADELRMFADSLDRDQVSVGIVSGPSGGAIYSYRVQPDQTHDRYFEQINAMLKKEPENGA